MLRPSRAVARNVGRVGNYKINAGGLHLAHDLNAVPMQDGVVIGGGRGQCACGRHSVSPVRKWLVLGCSCCCTPGRRRDRGVQAASAFAGNRNATPSSRFFSAKRRLSFWAEGASGAPGGWPPSATGGSRAKGSPPAGGKQCVKDRHRMAGTPRGPVRLWLKNQQDRRIEPDPQGYARLIDFQGSFGMRNRGFGRESGAYSS